MVLIIVVPMRVRPGDVYHRLTVVDVLGSRTTVQCTCGTLKMVATHNVPKIKSCGCYRREWVRTRVQPALIHGGHGTPEYAVWSGAKNRCHCTSNKDFAKYGGRGIQMCERWRSSFENFLADMGRRPSPGHSLDRVDVDGHYAPGNCRWATRSEQQRNKRSNVCITAQGVTRALAEWAEILGVPHETLRQRVLRGWPPEDVVGVPVQRRRKAT